MNFESLGAFVRLDSVLMTNRNLNMPQNRANEGKKSLKLCFWARGVIWDEFLHNEKNFPRTSIFQTLHSGDAKITHSTSSLQNVFFEL